MPRPQPSASPPPLTPLVLGIDESGLTLNQAPVATLSDLETRLRVSFDERSERTLFVRAASGVSYGRVVEALDVAKGAGAERIGRLPRSDR